MTTLLRDASAARLLLDLMYLSVKKPKRDRCLRPPITDYKNIFLMPI